MTYSIRVFCPTCNNIFNFELPERQDVDFDIGKEECHHCHHTGLKQLDDNSHDG